MGSVLGKFSALLLAVVVLAGACGDDSDPDDSGAPAGLSGVANSGGATSSSRAVIDSIVEAGVCVGRYEDPDLLATWADFVSVKPIAAHVCTADDNSLTGAALTAVQFRTAKDLNDFVGELKAKFGGPPDGLRIGNIILNADDGRDGYSAGEKRLIAAASRIVGGEPIR